MKTLVLLVMGLLACTSALALDLGDGAVLEGRAFYKTLGAGYALPEELVGDATGLPRWLAGPYHSARLQGRLLLGERWDISVGWQATAALASDAALLGGSGSGLLSGAVPANVAPAKRRLVDFDPLLLDHPTLCVGHNMDLLSVRYKTGLGDVVAGRQVLAWGTGRFWNPIDRLAPFAPSDLDREVRHGVDAVRWTLPLGPTALVDALWLPQRNSADQSAVLRAQANFLGWDSSVIAAKFADSALVGADLAGDVGAVAVHAELALSGPWAGVEKWRSNAVLRALLGGDWRPADKWLLSGEYLFDGGGSTDPSHYLGILRNSEHMRGEWFGAGRHRAGLATVYRWSEVLGLSATALVSFADPSALLLPSVEWWFEQNILVRTGVYVPMGRGVDSAAGLSTEAALGISSEYGSAPWGGFLQVGIYR